MPKPGQRTRSRKRVSRTMPGGRRSNHFVSSASNPRRCSICGKPLSSVSSKTRNRTVKSNRTTRIVWRPYGGQVCDSCLKSALRRTARTTS